MNYKMRATVIFEWEENTANWSEAPKTAEEVLKLVKDYSSTDHSYFLESDLKEYKIELVS